MSFLVGHNQVMNLQATIASTTAGTGTDGVAPVLPHHPITCSDEIYFDEEGDFSCTHAKAPTGDKRTQASLNHSMAVLLIELACKL